MRTLDDLDGAFAVLESEAATALPDVESLPVLARAARRRRFTITAVAAAAAVIVAGVGIAVARSNSDQHTRPARPTPATCSAPAHCPVLGSNGRPAGVPSAFSLDVATGSGWSVTEHKIDPNSEQLQLVSDAPNQSSAQAVVTSYGPRAPLPSYTSEQPVIVNGRKARYVSLGATAPDRGIVWSDGGRTNFVLFPYGYPGTSAASQDALLLSAADAVREAANSYALPFRFDSLPTSLVPESVQEFVGAGSADVAAVGFTDGWPTQQSSLEMGGAAVYVTLAGAVNPSSLTKATATTGGHPIYAGAAGGIQVQLDATTSVTLQANPARPTQYPTAALIEIAQHMTFAAKPGDAATWFSTDLFPKR